MTQRERGPLDHKFAQGHIPMDAPPGIEEMEYHRWQKAGGKVIPQPPPGDQYLWTLVYYTLRAPVPDHSQKSRSSRWSYGERIETVLAGPGVEDAIAKLRKARITGEVYGDEDGSRMDSDIRVFRAERGPRVDVV